MKASTVEMTFTGVNGATAFGDSVGPYQGAMNGVPVDLFCVDINNNVSIGQQWDANLTAITSGADLGETRYGGVPAALQLYQQAAWLTLQYRLQPSDQFGDIQATIWQLFSTSAPTPSSSGWLTEARSHYASIDYSEFRLVTNVGPVQPSGQVQEFLTQAPNPVPEPGTNLLIGFGLVSLSCFWSYVRN